MEEKINVFDIELNLLTEKKAMRQVMRYMGGESVSTIELIPMEVLLKGQDDAEWKQALQSVDLLLPSEREILESAEVTDQNAIQDLENNTFVRLFFRYLVKNKKKVFLLTEDEKASKLLKERIETYRKGIQFVGEAVISAQSGSKEAVINMINGVEPDCILSGLSYPWQEKFIAESKALLNARVLFGCTFLLNQQKKEEKASGKFKYFILKRLFRYQVGKTQKG